VSSDAQRSGSACGAGTTARTTSITVPMTTTLQAVPTPGRCRSGIHINSTALAEQLPTWSFRTPGGGLSLWVRLDGPVSSALARAAERHRLRLVPGPRFGVGANLESYLRLPFTLPEAELLDAVGRLAAARDGLGPGAAAPPASTAQVA